MDIEVLRMKVAMQTRSVEEMLRDLVALSSKCAADVVRDTAMKFAGHARRYMAPFSGNSQLPESSTRRRTAEIETMEAETPEDAAFKARAFNGGWRFLVYFGRRGAGGGTRPPAAFKTRGEMEKYAVIPTRGAARYGWSQAVRALGGRVPKMVSGSYRFACKAGDLMNVAGSTWVRLKEPEPSVSVENHSDACGDYWLLYSELMGRNKSASDLKRGIRRAEDALISRGRK